MDLLGRTERVQPHYAGGVAFAVATGEGSEIARATREDIEAGWSPGRAEIHGSKTPSPGSRSRCCRSSAGCWKGRCASPRPDGGVRRVLSGNARREILTVPSGRDCACDLNDLRRTHGDGCDELACRWN